MKTIQYILFICSISFLSACSDGSKSTVQQSSTEDPDTMEPTSYTPYEQPPSTTPTTTSTPDTMEPTSYTPYEQPPSTTPTTTSTPDTMEPTSYTPYEQPPSTTPTTTSTPDTMEPTSYTPYEQPPSTIQTIVDPSLPPQVYGKAFISSDGNKIFVIQEGYNGYELEKSVKYQYSKKPFTWNVNNGDLIINYQSGQKSFAISPDMMSLQNDQTYAAYTSISPESLASMRLPEDLPSGDCPTPRFLEFVGNTVKLEDTCEGEFYILSVESTPGVNNLLHAYGKTSKEENISIYIVALPFSEGRMHIRIF
ncbi:hypothetical protein VSS37_01390 [Candidatus Thiothrix sp. Deng01]|uniref:Uncharacterized protein n=1 Tax=Candidatus Thiothrix phosphatis TaxID=3112415 RepID=A0ABU6CSW3_9GAMM|nr:hypothetical protein [Candidatus Thiothrix sp. Deng01]MEB4589622.1 hypothetical protein [Candidatus Thiothrix sp. Deng01]